MIWPELSHGELEEACSAKIKGKCSGLDSINQGMTIRAYQCSPKTFYDIYSILFDIEYHPKACREATGAELKKPKETSLQYPKIIPDDITSELPR